MYGDTLALSFANRQTSYGQLYDEVASCAGALLELAPAAGGSVGILSLNCDRAIIGFYGAMWAGKVPNYLNIRWSIFELGASVDDFAPSILLGDKMFLQMGLDLKQRCSCLEHIILFEEQAELPPGVLNYSDALAQASPINDQSVGEHEMAFLNYTGGTTGKGKGVIHSHASHTATLGMCISENLFGRGPTLMTMPLFHISGIGISNAALMVGNTLYILPTTLLRFYRLCRTTRSNRRLWYQPCGRCCCITRTSPITTSALFGAFATVVHPLMKNC
jgi:acyl-CoA synthetase (AMP-forming)/AMP-acid ligase II